MACVTATVSIWIVVVGLVVLGGKILNSIWFRPKKLEKLLRQQGLAGNSYRILYGDLKDRAAMREQAISKPMNFSNDIAPRVTPSIHHTIQKYGKNSFMWLGPIPRVHIMDPEQLKTVFALFNDIQKPSMNPLVKLFAGGLVNHEGAKWAKHRKIINPWLWSPKFLNRRNSAVVLRESPFQRPQSSIYSVTAGVMHQGLLSTAIVRYGVRMRMNLNHEDSAMEFLKHQNFNPTFFPFGWGPRTCMGQDLVILEAKVAMSLILHRFSFEFSPSHAHAPTLLMTTQPQHGAHIIRI